uniref:Uncharacterized protein n=1 Tax=Mus musculus TaxID=10090 RepID=Q9D634_MOUSE|nr:unnamed protein product [Mus musculus]BAC26410.1 unnamed protein product [Mus musculus]
MEARSKLLDGTTASRRWTRKLVLLLPPLLLFLLRTESLQGLESDERFRTRENECHFYAGGQVYPGEASRVSVADHSLHLSKAKMFEASGHSQKKTRQTKKIVRKLRPAASGY